MNRFLRGCVSICLLSIVPCLKAQNSYEFSTVTGTGEHAPMRSRIGLAGSPTINTNGEIAYEADGAVFLKSRSDIVKIIAAIDVPAPGGGEFLNAGSPSLNDSGHVAFVGAAKSPSGSGIFLFTGRKSSLVVAEGQSTAAGPIFGLNSPSLNANDEVAFLSFNGVFTEASGTINKVAIAGDASPEGDVFSSFSFPQINRSGQVVFTASLVSGTTGIYLETNGTIQKVVNSNDSSPFGGTFAFFFDSASINDAGQIAFAGIVNGPGTSSGVYIFSGGQLSMKVSEFTPFGNGEQLVSTQSPSINAAGDVSFSGLLLNESDPGVFVTVGSSLVQITSPGQIAPDNGIFAAGFTPVLSDAGQVVFGAREQNVNNAVFLFSNSEIARIAGPGDPIDRPARFVFPFTSGGINNNGTVLFQDVTFPGGDGLFLGGGEKEFSVQLAAAEDERLPDGGSLFRFFENVALNDKNQVLFETSGFHDSNDLLLESAGTLTSIARGGISNGDPAPGGGTFFDFGFASLNNLGQVAFAGATIGGPGQGLYLYSQGQTTVLLDDFSIVPPGISLGTFALPSLNDNGDVAFFTQPFPQPNSILFLSGGSLSLIAQDGGAAPGGGNFSLPFPDPSFGPAVNVQGQIVFSANLSTGGEAVFLYGQAGLVRIAGPGDPTPEGGTFASASSAGINATGEIVFTGTTNTGDSGVYTYKNGQIMTVAHAGTSVGDGGSLVAAFLPAINAAGQVAFTGGLSDGKSLVLIASPSNVKSVSGTAMPLIGLSAPISLNVNQDRTRARIERVTRTGVFADTTSKIDRNHQTVPK